MAKDSKETYIESYSKIAIEQMKEYGIPASITLAQALLESSSGNSLLAKQENNHFGIKADSSWIAKGGEYGVYQDDKKDDKFRRYTSAEDSFRDHSKLLLTERYKNCFLLEADDYKGWAKEIKKAGYATDKNYEEKLLKIIKDNALDRFDKEAIKEAKEEGKEIGYLKNLRGAKILSPNKSEIPSLTKSSYSMPLERKETLFVTSPWGLRADPIKTGSSQNHKGIDFRASFEPILATEDFGKVSRVNSDSNSSSGKSITIDYKREDGSSVKVTYMHLSRIDVKVGDKVKAGQQIGVSGNTGSRTTGPHLHFQVAKEIDGKSRIYDPTAYLSEIAQKGGLSQTVEYNGENLLSLYKQEDNEKNNEPLSPQEWMKKLLTSEDSDLALSSSSDPIMDILVTAFTSLMVLAQKLDEKPQEEQFEKVNSIAETHSIDLKSIVTGFEKINLEAKEGKTFLSIRDNGKDYSLQLNSKDLNLLEKIVNDKELSKDEQAGKISLMVNEKINSLRLEALTSKNFNDISMEQEQSQNLKIR